ncbi:Uncharacterized protein TCAP_05513 [Tolypocladium capitatum]|uniref:Uncharacterized protein n=1 Tax=Tolypocladium capitatum TaxID=45235 RepID=A0A2K3QAM4_9HYPO|nr:Uncharacterized protein TCAP_05513 [Tolypocladium capitatum]
MEKVREPAAAGPEEVYQYIKPQLRKPHDPDVTFEEYHYYAHKTREVEETIEPTKTNWREILLRKKNAEPPEPEVHTPTEDELANRANRLEITDEEWTNASRAFRTASWGACECFVLALATSLCIALY